MKKNSFCSIAAILAVVTSTVSTSTLSAQDAPATAAATSTVQTAPPAATATKLAYGASQILQLAQAKVGDDTIITYIKNSGNSYALSADQIIYLQQQGLSTAVLNAMLSQPKTGGLAYLPTTAAPVPVSDMPPDSQPAYDSQPATSTVTVGPAVTAIDPTAAAAYAAPYYQPYYYPNYSYPYYYPAYGYYGYYPGVGVSIGWGGYGWRGGGFRGGGYRGGGFHAGGGFHGGGFHGGGSHGGGFHH